MLFYAKILRLGTNIQQGRTLSLSKSRFDKFGTRTINTQMSHSRLTDKKNLLDKILIQDEHEFKKHLRC